MSSNLLSPYRNGNHCKRKPHALERNHNSGCFRFRCLVTYLMYYGINGYPVASATHLLVLFKPLFTIGFNKRRSDVPVP